MALTVLQALSGGHLGGTESMVSHLVAGLLLREVEAEVSVLDGGGVVTDRLSSMGVRVHVLPSHGRAVPAVCAFHRLLQTARYDLIQLYGFRMSLIGRAAVWPLRRRPVVIHGIRGLHVTEGVETHSLRTRAAVALERAASGLLDHYIANSQGAVDFLSGHGLPREKFSVVRNGIDTELWRTSGDTPRATPPLIVTVANLRPVKALGDLIVALGELRRRGGEFRAIIVGEGPLRSELERAREREGLEKILTLPGQMRPEEIRELLGRSTVFVLTSLWEGMPVSVMEAMAMGLPVVGTDVPGIREVVVPGRTGLLVPAREPVLLASALQALLTSEDTRTAMGAAGRQRAVEEFSLSGMIDRHVELYRSLVACRRH